MVDCLTRLRAGVKCSVYSAKDLGFKWLLITLHIPDDNFGRFSISIASTLVIF
jgi:hypothetical protein